MATITPRETLYTWFETDDMPTQEQFAAWLDSYFHQQDKIPVDSIDGLQAMLDQFVIDVTTIVTEAAKGLQLEKRIGITLDGIDTADISLDEPLKIYQVGGKNVSKVEIKADTPTVTEWTNLPLNTAIDISLDYAKMYNAVIRITRTTTDNKSSVYIYATVNKPQVN